MACFLGCFGSSKDRKRKKQSYKIIPRDQKPKSQNHVKSDVSLDQSIKEKPYNSVPESRGKTEEPSSLRSRKRVTFDTNVTTYEHIQVYDSTESLLGKNEKGETFPKSARTQFNSNSKDDSIASNVGSHVTNYRYGDCLESDVEVEDLDYEDDDDLEDEEGYNDEEDGIMYQEVWSKSIPVPSTESRVCYTVESNRNAQDRSAYVLSVLNPVENLTQWKALKSKETTRKPLTFDRQKENSHKSKNQNQDTAVDASLSNWLASLQKNTPNNKRVVCYNTNLDTIAYEKNSSQRSTTTSLKRVYSR